MSLPTTLAVKETIGGDLAVAGDAITELILPCPYVSAPTAVGAAASTHPRRKVRRSCPGEANVVAVHAVTRVVRCVSFRSSPGYLARKLRRLSPPEQLAPPRPQSVTPLPGWCKGYR
jgi:hypothetical protein